MRNKILPPAYFLIAAVAIGILHFAWPIARIIDQPWRWLGVALIIFGGAINIWADRLFSKHGTTVKPHEKPAYLIVFGPFRASRHPMYLGMTAILLGIAVSSGTIAAFIPPIIFVFIMEKIFIPVEEQNLLETFGQKYADYKKKTRRWL